MRLFRSNKPVIAITMGDAAGIGPEVTLKALDAGLLNKKAGYLVIGDGRYLEELRKDIKTSLPLHIIDPEDLRRRKVSLEPDSINTLDLKNIKKYEFGKIQADCGRAAVQYIDTALDLIKRKETSAVVTAPVSKEAINRTGVKFVGHTEYLAAKAGVKGFGMMFVAGHVKIVLVTRHIPLRDVSSSLSAGNIIKTTVLTASVLKRFFGINNPRIGVLSVNPHAGESGLFGSEEARIISPAVKKLKNKISSVYGPLPSDSAFRDLYNRKYDVLVCMYHDQGMIPLKMLSRNSAVNFTMGLPYIRTSPAHGTAFDIAGKLKADPSPMLAALKLAGQMTESLC